MTLKQLTCNGPLICPFEARRPDNQQAIRLFHSGWYQYPVFSIFETGSGKLLEKAVPG